MASEHERYDLLLDELFRLKRRLDIVEEENRQLRQLLVPTKKTPLEWGLTRSEEAALMALHKHRKGATHAQIKFALWGWDEGGMQNTQSVIMSKLRRKMKALGIKLENVREVGFRLTDESWLKVDKSVT